MFELMDNLKINIHKKICRNQITLLFPKLVKRKCKRFIIGLTKFHYPDQKRTSQEIFLIVVSIKISAINIFVLFSIVLIAEVLKHYLPQMVELHNYSNAHSV